MELRVQKVMLMMMMMVGAVMQLHVPVVQARHLITTSSTAADAQPAPVSTSRSSSEGGGPVTYIVGESFGWTVPSGATTYSTWASDKTFNVGDILVFNFANQAHTVAEVTKTAFDSCSSETTTATSTISPARITLTRRPGPHYFICTVPQHCSLGQKLAINVTRGSSSSDTPPPPSPSINATPSTSTTPSADGVIINAPPTVPSSAPPSLMAALPVALLSIALAFFC